MLNLVKNTKNLTSNVSLIGAVLVTFLLRKPRKMPHRMLALTSVSLEEGAGGLRRSPLISHNSEPMLYLTGPKRRPLSGLWQHLLVFVFGPQDNMSGDVALDVPNTLHNDQTGLTSPITIRPSTNAVDVIVTAPTPPVSYLTNETRPSLNDTLELTDADSSQTIQGTPNGNIHRRDRDTRPNSLPDRPRPSPSNRRPRDRLGRHRTVSGVTEEARKVLEQFLSKSASQEDGQFDIGDLLRSREKKSELTVPKEAARGSSLPDNRSSGLDLPDGLPSRQVSAPYGLPPTHQGAAAGAATGHQAAYLDSVAMPDDDATSHSPISCPNSLYSFSSRSSSHRNRIQIDKSIKDQKELMKAAEKEQLKRKNKKKRGQERRLDRRNSTGSSSSSEYEIINGQLQLRRKESLFKRARDRIQASFRRKKKKPSGFDPYRIDDDEIREAQEQKPKVSDKKKFNFSLPRRSRSSAERSPEHDVSREIRRHRSQGNPEGRQWAVRRESADQPPKKDHKGIFESILRSLRKGVSLKRRDKGASKDGSRPLQSRSRSADPMVHHAVYPNDRSPYAVQYQGPITTSNQQGLPGLQEDTTRASYCRYHSEEGGQAHITHHTVDPHLPTASHAQQDPQVLPQGLSALHNTDYSCNVNVDRSNLHLQGLIANGPAPAIRPHPQSNFEQTLTLQETTTRLTVTSYEDQRSQRGSSVEHSGLDEIDGIATSVLDTSSQQEQVVHKPFPQKTAQEKEELYEKIAAQLAAIADNYNLDSPRSLKNDLFRSSPLGGSTIPKSASAPAAAAVSPPTGPTVTTSPPTPRENKEEEREQGATASASLTVPSPPEGAPLQGQEGGGARRGGRTPIEQKIGRILRDKGDKAAVDMTELEPVVSELVRNASYSRFQQIIHENVDGEPGWQQVAILFNLTRSAVQLAGLGTAAALQIKELTLRYFEDKFAGWIVGQGGWESMVEDTDLSSEVD